MPELTTRQTDCRWRSHVMEYAGHHCTFFLGVCVCLGLDRVAGRVSFLIVHNLVDTFAHVGSVVVLVRKACFFQSGQMTHT